MRHSRSPRTANATLGTSAARLLLALVPASLAIGVVRGEQTAANPAGVVVADDLRGPLRLAISPTGQVLYALRGGEGDVLAIDLDDPTRRWQAVAARPGMKALAVGAIDSGTLAIVGREGDSLSLRVHRLAAPGMPPGESEVQSVPLGVTGAAGGEVRIVVSPSRDWLAVTGLPEPLPRVARATITGTRLGAISERRCPRTSQRPSAVAVGNHSEWILFGPSRDADGQGAMLSWFSPSGAQRLLDLDSGLDSVNDAAIGKADDVLWVLAPGGNGAQRQSGLWRIDAALSDSRQVAVPVAVAPLETPTALVPLPKGGVAVAHGTDPARIVRFPPPSAGKEVSP